MRSTEQKHDAKRYDIDAFQSILDKTGYSTTLDLKNDKSSFLIHVKKDIKQLV